MTSRVTPAQPWKPTKEQRLAAVAKTVPDLLRPGLDCVFVGINPGLYSGAVGHHFAGPGNGFWPAMFAGGFTPRLFTAFDEAALLDDNYGITNLVARTTATADQLSKDEIREGGAQLRDKAERFAPRFIAMVGLTSFRIAFARPKAVIGSQPERLGPSQVWLLPNPSGLNTHHPPAVMAQLFRELHAAVRPPGGAA